MNNCKVVGIGCLGRSDSFRRIWQEVVPGLAGREIVSGMNLDQLPNAVKTACLYIGQDDTVTVNLSVSGKLKRGLPARKPALKMIKCG